MKLQQVLLPQSTICDVKEMYFRGEGITYKENIIKISKNNILTSDTYFNSFSYKKWIKYTNLSNLSIEFDIQGVCDIYLCGTKIDEKNIIRRINDNVIVEHINGERKKVKLTFKNIEASQMVYFKIKAIEDTYIYDASYFTNETKGKVNDINLAVGICTYKREKYIYNNMRDIRQSIMSNGKSLLGKNLTIFIADNGRTLAQNAFNSKKIRIFKNENAGGSGGFTRAMIEILKSNADEKFTHFILMDDDVIIDPNVLERNYAFLKLIKTEYINSIIGGAMLIMHEKNRQFENGGRMECGYLKFKHKNLNLSFLRNVIENEYEAHNNYNAWCYCCMPISVLREDNLPLPLFIHMDDVEYGLRNKLPIININGICVWHPFYSNQRGAAIVYYDMRNKMIAFSGSKKIELKNFALDYLRNFRSDIFRYNYARTMAACKGFQDYCKGIDEFKKIDPVSLNKDLTQKYNMPWYALTPDILKRVEKPEQISDISTIRKRKFWNFILPAKRKEVVYDCDIFSVDTYRIKKILVVNRATNQYCVYKKNRLEMLRCWFECKKTAKIIKRDLVRVSFEWKKRLNELTNINFWNQYLKLDNQEKR